MEKIKNSRFSQMKVPKKKTIALIALEALLVLGATNLKYNMSCIVEDANGKKHTNVREMTWQINDQIVTRLMYTIKNGEETIYVSVTEPDGQIIEKKDENGIYNYYSAQQLFPTKQVLEIVTIRDYVGENLTFENAVAYEDELNERYNVLEIK